MELKNNQLDIINLRFEVLGFEVEGQSRLDLQNGNFNSSATSKRKFGEHIFFDNLSDAQEIVNLDITGSVSEENANGTWSYLLTNSDDTVLNITGKIGLEKNIFSLSNDRTFNNDFLITLQVVDVFNNPMVNFGYVDNLPFHVFTSREWVRSIFQKYDVEGILVGSVNDLNAQITIVDKVLPERQFALTTSLKNLIKTEKTISGSIQFNKLLGEYNINLGDDYIMGSFHSNHSLVGTIDINLRREEQVRAKVHLDNFAVNTLLSDTTLTGYGELDGNIDVTGSLDDPKVVAKLRGDQFIVNEMGYYSFELDLQADTSQMVIDTLQVALNNEPILNGSLKVDYIAAEVNAIA